MSLQTKLDNLREQFEFTAPPEALAVMHRATKDLLASNIMDGVLKTGLHQKTGTCRYRQHIEIGLMIVTLARIFVATRYGGSGAIKTSHNDILKA